MTLQLATRVCAEFLVVVSARIGTSRLGCIEIESRVSASESCLSFLEPPPAGPASCHHWHQLPIVSPTTACAASIMGISGPAFLQLPHVWPASWASAAHRFSNHRLCGQHHGHQLPIVSPTIACAASIMGISCPAFLQPPPVRPAS